MGEAVAIETQWSNPVPPNTRTTKPTRPAVTQPQGVTVVSHPLGSFSYPGRSWSRSSWSGCVGRWGRSGGPRPGWCSGPSAPAGGSGRRTAPWWSCPWWSWWGCLAGDGWTVWCYWSSKSTGELGFRERKRIKKRTLWTTLIKYMGL